MKTTTAFLSLVQQSSGRNAAKTQIKSPDTSGFGAPGAGMRHSGRLRPAGFHSPAALLRGFAVFGVVAWLAPAHLSAKTITVMNTSDSGPGSLRAALASANDGDTINFDVSVTGTITLTSGALPVNKSVTIQGPSANILAVSGNGLSSVFYIASGEIVTISDLTITNGKGNNGGGIYNDHATLTVTNSSVSRSDSSNAGAGIYNDHGTLTVSDSTLSDNNALGGSPDLGGGTL